MRTDDMPKFPDLNKFFKKSEKTEDSEPKKQTSDENEVEQIVSEGSAIQQTAVQFQITAQKFMYAAAAGDPVQFMIASANFDGAKGAFTAAALNHMIASQKPDKPDQQ